MMRSIFLVAAIAAVTACGGKLPDTRYYQLSVPHDRVAGGDLTLVLEPLATDPGYDDERIVYRTTPYRLDYYQYHRWSAAPGTLIGNYLEQALERSGKFRAVVREASSDAPAVLGGRVVAIEEVDLGPKRWVGRVVVELAVSDPRSGMVLWSEQFEETEPLDKQTPEGLAKALSSAMARIATRAAPAIAIATEQAKAKDPAVARTR